MPYKCSCISSAHNINNGKLDDRFWNDPWANIKKCQRLLEQKDDETQKQDNSL